MNKTNRTHIDAIAPEDEPTVFLAHRRSLCERVCASLNRTTYTHAIQLLTDDNNVVEIQDIAFNKSIDRIWMTFQGDEDVEYDVDPSKVLDSKVTKSVKLERKVIDEYLSCKKFRSKEKSLPTIWSENNDQ